MWPPLLERRGVKHCHICHYMNDTLPLSQELLTSERVARAGAFLERALF